MTNAYDQFQNLTDDEKIYILKHPHHVSTIRDSKEIAFSETKKKFGHNGRNDSSDAFRHCFWSAILSRDLGYLNAMEFTTAHESSPLNNAKEKEMDLHNNSIGLKIGQNKDAKSSIGEQCMAALKDRKLKVIKK